MKRSMMNPNVASLCCVALLVVAMIAAGCTGTGEKTTPIVTTQHPQVSGAPVGTGTEKTGTTLSGVPTKTVPIPGEKHSIRISGSTTVLPIAQKAAEAYMATRQDADIQVSGGGSGVGIQQIGEKTVDIGMSSRELTSTEATKYPGLVRTVVAKDGIAIIVNRANTVSVISAENVRGIYTGQITKWSQIMGAGVPNTNQQIVAVGRDSASGTREFFDKAPEGILQGAAPVKTMLEKNSNGAVAQTIAQTPGAIGYVSIGFVTQDVKALPIWYNNPNDAVAPTAANVQSLKYPINRELLMFTNGQPSGLAKDFLDFIRSPDGQKMVEDEGYVRIT